MFRWETCEVRRNSALRTYCSTMASSRLSTAGWSLSKVRKYSSISAWLASWRNVGTNALGHSSSTEMPRTDAKYHSLSRRMGPPMAGLTSWMFETPCVDSRPSWFSVGVRLLACHPPSVKPM